MIMEKQKCWSITKVALRLSYIFLFQFSDIVRYDGENLPTIAAFLCIYKFHPMSRTITNK